MNEIEPQTSKTRVVKIDLTKISEETAVFNPIKELAKKLPIADGNVLVDEFGKYKGIAIMLGLEITEFKGKLAYKIVDSKEEDGLN